MSDHPAEPLKSKLLFCWLALLTGPVGGHWIYAGRKRFWFYMMFFPLSAFAGWFDAIRYGLMPDATFNTTINPGYPSDTKQTNGLVVTAIGLSLAFATTAFMSLLAMLFQWYFSGMVS
ncbi:hypothetical protein [Limnobacter sp.]|uniref:hypothetical protein n=1 Tax=Limnobacter sp. TaxID=2003368 RepID=UPI00351988EF